MSSSDSDSDTDVNALRGKFDKRDLEVNYSDNEKMSEKKSVQNSNKNQKIEKVIKDSPIKEIKTTKKSLIRSDDRKQGTYLAYEKGRSY